MTLEAIKEAIAELSYTERTSLVIWLNAQDAEAWDSQIEADFPKVAQAWLCWNSRTLKMQTGNRFLDEFLRRRRTPTNS
jgi:hypothetical protein